MGRRSDIRHSHRDMCAVIEGIRRILEGSAHLVERLTALPYIMLCDKYDVGFRKVEEECSFTDLTRINHAAVEPRTTWNRSFVAALDLYIVDVLAIGCKCVKSYSTSVEIRHTLLRDDLRHAQAVIVQHSTKHDLHTVDITVKAAVKERVVHQPKLFDLLKVSTLLLLEFDDNHLKSNKLPIFYRELVFFARLSFLLRAKNVITDFSSSFLLCLLHYVRIKVSCNGNRTVSKDFGSCFHGNAGLQHQRSA